MTAIEHIQNAEHWEHKHAEGLEVMKTYRAPVMAMLEKLGDVSRPPLTLEGHERNLVEMVFTTAVSSMIAQQSRELAKMEAGEL